MFAESSRVLGVCVILQSTVYSMILCILIIPYAYDLHTPSPTPTILCETNAVPTVVCIDPRYSIPYDPNATSTAMSVLFKVTANAAITWPFLLHQFINDPAHFFAALMGVAPHLCLSITHTAACQVRFESEMYRHWR